ncbi:unnamed protein product [Leuciscus chuanchicus]
MELLLFLLILMTASSSIISAGNDTNLTSTAPPNITASTPWSVASSTAVQIQKTVSSTFSSQHEDDITRHTSKNVSTTTAPLSSGHTGSTDGSSLASSNRPSGQSMITSFTFTPAKSYIDTTLNAISSPAAKTTVGVALPKTSTTVHSNISMSEVMATPPQAPDSSLTLLAFGVMSFILILIVVMVILVTTINLRGRCRDTRQNKDVKSYDRTGEVSDR